MSKILEDLEGELVSFQGNPSIEPQVQEFYPLLQVLKFKCKLVLEHDDLEDFVHEAAQSGLLGFQHMEMMAALSMQPPFKEDTVCRTCLKACGELLLKDDPKDWGKIAAILRRSAGIAKTKADEKTIIERFAESVRSGDVCD